MTLKCEWTQYLGPGSSPGGHQLTDWLTGVQPLDMCALRLINGSFGLGTRFLAPSSVRLVRKTLYGSQPSADTGTNVTSCGQQLEVHHSRWPHCLHFTYTWLRDHCRCPQCYDHKTYQRKYEISNIPLGIRPVAVKATEKELKVKWPDGHESGYEYKFLWQNTFEGQQTSYRMPQLPWTTATLPEAHQTTVPLGDLCDPEKGGVKRLIYAIVKHGFAFISEVPADIESTRTAIEKVCNIKNTFFGDMWSMKGTNYEHFDSAYSTAYIGAHTDSTYFTQACRIQVFHCLQPATEGGENLLVDGFSIAKQFRDKHPKGYAFLSSEAIPSEYIEDGQHQVSLDTIFKHNPVTRNIKQFRYNIYDRAPLSSLPMEKTQDFYTHFSNLSKIINNPKNEYWLKLNPGTVLLTDNWRLMHGRANFTGARFMCGCYLDNDDFCSKARVLEVQLE
ncbi:trimethyllysine dioxygenase, mitochondrial-like [Homarus americanus]|uniref:trimethyllysine dioxygenase, mitochondrial-like n=1 Tax=Homarus americanus TaxID=6706 RepID=UPI001C44E55A|nr:trimethyllysine dioxygenase, mitochondrial-like [Homarus americanus]